MPNKSLSEELAEVSTSLLEAEGLVLSTDASALKAKLAAGTMKAEDWLLAIEKALNKERPA